LQHFSGSDPADHFDGTDKDKGISHHTVLDHDVMGSGRGEACSERMDDDTVINDDVSNNSHLGNTSVP
jgi:hypothetical protein